MTVVKGIGKRFLWVDSACINQTDDAHKAQQIKIMSDIYQGAYATIIAFCSPSANQGIPRVSSPSGFHQLRCSVDDVALVGLGPTLTHMAWELSWARRAWTYQEAILSPTCIYLSRFTTYFECNAMTCCETLDESQSPVHQVPKDQAYFRRENWLQQVNSGVLRNPLAGHLGVEDKRLKLYSSWVNEYTKRSMTKQADALHAFSGILQALRESIYPDGIFYALPYADFNWALWWQGPFGFHREEEFPTWSWLSWQGNIWAGQSFDLAYDAYQYCFDMQIWRYAAEGPQTIFRTFQDSMAESERLKLLQDPITDLPPYQDNNRVLSFLQSLPEREHLLCIDSVVLCCSPEDWILLDDEEDNDRDAFRIEADGISLHTKIMKHHGLRDVSKRKGPRTFLLLARDIEEDIPDRVTYFLLMLRPREGFFERECALRVKVKIEESRVLKSLGLQRASILLG